MSHYQNLDSEAIGETDSHPRQKVKFEGGLFTLNHYRQYFDITTAEFLHNCLYSINPVVSLTDSEIDSVGDLYGAIWITGTIIFLLFFSNTLADLIGEWIKHQYNSNQNYFHLLIFSINLLYGYMILVPVLLYLLLRFYFRVPKLIALTRLISIYGYANLSWIPASFLGILRGLLANHSTLTFILRWVLIGLGGLVSGVNITWKINSYLKNQDARTKWITVSIVVVLHAAFTLAVKVSFFGDLK